MSLSNDESHWGKRPNHTYMGTKFFAQPICDVCTKEVGRRRLPLLLTTAFCPHLFRSSLDPLLLGYEYAGLKIES